MAKSDDSSQNSYESINLTNDKKNLNEIQADKNECQFSENKNNSNAYSSTDCSIHFQNNKTKLDDEEKINNNSKKDNTQSESEINKQRLLEDIKIIKKDFNILTDEVQFESNLDEGCDIKKIVNFKKDLSFKEKFARKDNNNKKDIIKKENFGKTNLEDNNKNNYFDKDDTKYQILENNEIVETENTNSCTKSVDVENNNFEIDNATAKMSDVVNINKDVYVENKNIEIDNGTAKKSDVVNINKDVNVENKNTEIDNDTAKKSDVVNINKDVNVENKNIESIEDDKNIKDIETKRKKSNDNSKSIFSNSDYKVVNFGNTSNIFTNNPSANKRKTEKSSFLEQTKKSSEQQEITSKPTDYEKSLGDCQFQENCTLYKFFEKWGKIGSGTVYIYEKKMTRLIFIRDGLMNVILDFYIDDVKPYLKGKGVGFVSNIGNVLLMFSDESIQSKFFNAIKK